MREVSELAKAAEDAGIDGSGRRSVLLPRLRDDLFRVVEAAEGHVAPVDDLQHGGGGLDIDGALLLRLAALPHVRP
jgi:hypothetical protein